MTHIHMDRGLLAQMVDILPTRMPYHMLGIVCDETTAAIAGKAILSQCGDRAALIPLGKRIRPTLDLSERLYRQSTGCDALLAVGSGSITDLTRYVAHRRGMPFSVFATAPSMNGYLSPTSSLISGKQKSSFPARPPVSVIADLDVLTQAPLRMIRAGIGDLMCRSSIESDLILAHRFTGAPYTPQDFTRLREIDEELRTYEGELYARDAGLIERIIEGLFIGGRLMQQHSSSAPCSQSEHMIAHTYEMLYGGAESNVLHGEAISVTTVTMVQLQQKLLKRKPRLKPVKPSLERFRRIFGKAACESLYRVYLRKALSPERCEELNDCMLNLWPQILEEVETVAIRALQLEGALSRLGCPTSHKQLRWNRDRYENAVTSAHFTRDRFTFLDIPAMDKMLRAEI